MLEIKQLGGSNIKVQLSGRMAPFQPLTDRRDVRIVKTLYPGTSAPSIQVLGSDYADLTLEGIWDDAYLADVVVQEGGTAQNLDEVLDLVKALEQMRDEQVRVALRWEGIYYEGLIRELEIQWHASSRCQWRITLERTAVKYGEARAPQVQQPRKTKEDWLQEVVSTVKEIAGKWEDALDTVQDLERQYIQRPLQVLNNTILTASDLLQRSIDLVNEPARIARDVAITLSNVKQSIQDTIDTLRTIPQEYRRAGEAFQDLTHPLAVQGLDRSSGDDVEDLSNIMQISQTTAALEADMTLTAALVEEARLAAVQEVSPDIIDIYVVRQDDTLEGISAHYYGRPDMAQMIMEVNELESPLLMPGMVLMIPGEAP